MVIYSKKLYLAIYLHWLIPKRGSKERFFDISSGWEEVTEECDDEVDHGRKGCCGAAVTGFSVEGCEQTAAAFEASVAMGQDQAPENALEVLFEGRRSRKLVLALLHVGPLFRRH